MRVRVAGSAVNPTDTKRRSGWRGQSAMLFARIVPHQDGAELIDAGGLDNMPTRRVERVRIYEAQWRRACGAAAECVVVHHRSNV